MQTFFVHLSGTMLMEMMRSGKGSRIFARRYNNGSEFQSIVSSLLRRLDVSNLVYLMLNIEALCAHKKRPTFG